MVCSSYAERTQIRSLSVGYYLSGSFSDFTSGRRGDFMGKYEALWMWIKETGKDSFKLTFAQIGQIAGCPIDHSFLTYKKELTNYGYQVVKISMKEQTVVFQKLG